MDAQSATLSPIHDTIFPSQLAELFNAHHDAIDVLSLDCFDTLLWRKTATPTDVFYHLQAQPHFQTRGITALQRVQAEEMARKLQLLRHGTSEVRLRDIYENISQHLSETDMTALIDAELTVEATICYGYPATMALIEEAHAKGLKIVIVSDTYLQQAELTQLLQRVLPAAIFDKIHRVYCSNEYGMSKSRGLFKHVLHELTVQPEKILHIGDNFQSDYVASKRHNMRAAHLVQTNDYIRELSRLYTAASSMTDPDVRGKRALHLPFHGLLASKNFAAATPDQLIGYASLGQIIYPFARFICDEIVQLEKQGKAPKVAFLLRDAYLPAKACEAIIGKPVGACVRISRFTAYAVSFRSRDDVDRYLASVITTSQFNSIAKQLLLPEKFANRIITESEKSADPMTTFIERLQEEKTLAVILKQSTLYRARFKKYLDKQMQLEPGDTLMMVDLGYSGTAQKQLEPLFRDEWQIDVIGRYLLQLRVADWETSRRGLIDPSWCDDRAMHMLVSYIALLEQLCTTHEKSVIDYDQDGEPVYADIEFDPSQYQKLHAIQTQCLQFCRDAETYFSHVNHIPTLAELRFAAMGELSRLLFLPTAIETHYLGEFQFDLNLGTKDVFHIFDIEKGLTALRRRGIFSLFMEKNSTHFRTNVPTEFRTAGIEYAMTLMAQHRFGVNVNVSDTTLRLEQLQTIVMNGKDHSQATLSAQATYDGYFSLIVPLGTGGFQLGLLLGQSYQWFQLECAELIPSAHLFTANETRFAEDYRDKLIWNNIKAHDDHLFECLTPAGFMMLAPTLDQRREWVFRMVFRPITKI